MIGRADIEGSKSNIAMNAWLPQASYPCGTCYIDSICYKLKYFNRISMILSSICQVNVDHCQQRCHLQFTMVCADTEIGLGLDSENNNIRICKTSGAVEIKKSR